jgi:hypothetical protein
MKSVTAAGPARALASWVLLAACASPSPAIATRPDAGGCVPGTLDCGADGLSPRRCTDHGAWLPLGACDGPGGQVCAQGRCAGGCAEAAAQHDPRGCSFRPVQSLNSALGRLADGADRDGFPFTVVATNPWASPVTITLSGGALASPVRRTVAPGEVASVEVPWQPALVDGGDYRHRASGVVRGGALHLTSTAPITAYQFNPLRPYLGDACVLGPACFAYTGDGSRLLPEHSLGRAYVAATVATERILSPESSGWSASPGFLVIVGTTDGTEVSVRLAGDAMASRGDATVPASAAGATLHFTLGAGDVVQLLSHWDELCAHDVDDPITKARFCLPVDAEDLTGTEVTASAPIAVFAGHDCATVPFDRYACDHLEEQVPPVETLGRQYVIARARPVDPPHDSRHPEGEPVIVRLVAIADDTALQFDPPRVHGPATLTRGASLTLTAAEPFAVEGSRPFLAATLLVSGGYFPLDVPDPRGRDGDPAMAFETPVEQFHVSYDLFAAPGYDQGFVDLVAPRGARVRLDEVVVTATPVAVGVHDLYQLPLGAGAHRVESEGQQAGLGARVCAYGPYTAYLLSGGGSLRAITVPP